MKRVYRSYGQAIGVLVIAVVFLLVILGTIVESRRSSPPLVLITVAGVGLGGFAFLLRVSLSGVEVDEEARVAIVRNPLKTVRIPESEIIRFSLGSWGPFPVIGIAEMKDGRRTHIFGVQAPNPLVRRKDSSAERLIADLNETLGVGRSRESPPSPRSTDGDREVDG